MKKYPKYKASGVEWLGEIPSEWNDYKVKFAVNVNKYTLSESTAPEFEFRYIDIESVTGSSIEKTQKIIFENAPSRARRIVMNGDVILSTVRTYLKAIAQVKGIEGEIVASTGFAVFSASKIVISNYLKYLAVNDHFIQSIECRSKGTSYPAIAPSELVTIKVSIPPLPEQHSIVRFLDHKTNRIDRFIANRQKQIELLKEQKAAIINKAVTKGINPNAKMKDSEIEWIGEVPEHWMIGKVRRVLNILTDFTANGSFADLAKNVKYLDTPDHSRLIRLTDLREDLTNEGIYVNKEAHKFLAKSELFGGEILMANVGAYAGLVCLVPKLDFVATLGPNMFLLKFDDKQMSNQFAFTLLGSNCYYKLLMNKALSSAQPKLNKEDVKSIDFIFPPTHKEQDAILEFINEETSNVATIISKYQKQIDLMLEYRTALISQAVTGTIDVRDWKPKTKQYKTEEIPMGMAAESTRN
jgi:type I restriction enzyme S subunit